MTAILVLLILALLCFLVDAIAIQTGNFNLTAFGLALATVAFMLHSGAVG